MSGRGLGALLLAGAALGAPAGAAPPAATVEVKVSRAGFTPARIAAHRGEPIRLALTSDDGEHCFAIDALRVEKRVARGRATVVELTPDRNGTFVFYCCIERGAQAEKERGELVVSE